MQSILDFFLGVTLEQYTTFILIWGGLGVVAGIAMYFQGKLPISSKMDDLNERWLGSIDKKLGWILMEIPILITVLFFHIASSTEYNVSSIIVAFFVLHYTNRALIYPYRIKAEGKRMPVASMLSSMVFYAINGYLIGFYFGAFKAYPIEWLYDPRFILGAALFLFGFYVNIQSDNILMNLRKPGETGYKIPKGGFYKWISCPNYFGEIIEWTGFALMSWSLPGVVYALWVGLPLISQGIHAHKWYLEKFADNYPKERKAVIPFLL
jgi:protein-S-isoprenylcysteine O-methyltransferase Ste14